MLKKFFSLPVFNNTLTVPILLALFQFILLLSFHESYGYFRDELYYIACTDHLAFGYVDQPPLSIAILWLNRMLLGDSLLALRFLPALSGSIVVVIAALIARQLGGSRFAQGLASLSVVAAPGLIAHGKLFSMNPFDILFWTLASFVLVIILSEDKRKNWLWFGVAIGLGLMNKYSIGFMVIGLTAGLILTAHRRHLATIWFWAGAFIAGIIFLPHVVWEIANGLPSIEFMRNASQNKNIDVGFLGFFVGQLRDMNLMNAPLWLGGIYFFFAYDSGRYRPLAWMFIVVFITMVVGHAKIYYLSAMFPLFLAGGAVWFDRIIQQRTIVWLKPVFVTLVSLVAIAILPFAVPVLPVDQFIKYEHMLGLAPRPDERSALADLPQYYADQFGWKEFVDTIAGVYAKLTPEERSQCLIFVRNYGEAGAVDFFGKKYGLPKAICAHNSYWHWGPGEHPGNIAIIVGSSRNLDANYADLRRAYQDVEFAATTYAKYAMPFENGRMIFLCKKMNTTFQKIWPEEKFYI